MEIALPQESIIQVSGEVVERNRLNPYTLELVLQCDTPLDYHAGQTVFLMNAERVGKRLPIASPPVPKTPAAMRFTCSASWEVSFRNGLTTGFASAIK